MKDFIKKYYKYLVFFVALLIPFIYSFFYLKAYWDPYNSLEDLNVAIVNLDNDKNAKYSEDFIENLKNSGSCNFKVVDREKAEDGLINGKYYAVLTIPKDFSHNFDNIKNKNRKTTTLTYSANQKSNFLASQILNSVINESEKSLDNEINSKIVKELKSSLDEVPDSLDSIIDGSNELKNGTSKLDEGVKSAKSGSSSLKSGAKSLRDGLGTLSSGQQKITSGAKTLNSGLDSLKGGSNSLKSGASSLRDGINDLDSGIGKLNENYKNIDSGIGSLDSGINSLSDGLSSLETGSNQLKTGIKGYTDNTKNLVTLISYCEIKKDENGGMVLDTDYNAVLKANYGIDCNNIKTLMAGLTDENTVSSLNTGAENLSTGITNAKTGTSSLKDGLGKLKSGSSEFSNGLNSLKDGSNKLKGGANSLVNGTNDLDKGVSSLKDGSKTLYNGSLTLTNGVSTIKKGSNSLYDGTVKLDDGLNELSNGSSTLDSGVSTFKDKISSSKDETKEALSDLKGLGSYSKKPVTINKKPYAKINTYGMSFVPLFLSIGLWVGALMSYIVFFYDQERKFGLLDSKNASLKQDLAYLGISVIYGFLTAFLIRNLLGFNVVNIPLYYISSIIIAVTFMSIMQFFIRSFGDFGKFIALIVLVLQLAASGGTFPIETVDKCFQVFNKFLPMTYSIKLIKEVAIKQDTGFTLHNIVILLSFAIICFILARIIDFVKKDRGSKK